MWRGVDYYPEQWDEAFLEEDLENICELGCNVIRIAEFAWHLMEKTEGNYDFSFFDRVIEKAKEKGLKVIMGTPTATIPAWLVKKHPDILSEFEDGTVRTFGGRHVYCFNSDVMYEYSEKIIRAQAEHYKNEDAIVAWQIDNELGHEDSDICYCPKCRCAFQGFLEQKFEGNIDKLNEIYGTTFWSQEYNGFDEIPLPSKTITTHNPALRLDWERFRSESIVKFANFQTALLKEIIPDAVVMHDFPGGGLGKHVDYSEVAKNLDVVAYNNYPVWGGQKEPLPANEIAFGLDYIRGLKRENFWITEAIMGAQGHDVTGFAPRPNQAKLWSYQSMARGCESLMYFRYRGATKGAEQFCYGILDADNVKRRKFHEVQGFFNEIKNYEKELSAPVKSEVAIVYDYDSLAAFRIQRQSFLLDCEAEMKKFHKVFFDANVPVDVISAGSTLSGYKIVILPQMIIAKPDFQKQVKEFTENGGTLVLTFRDFVKDENNNLLFKKVLPVDFDEFAGIYVTETESLQEGQKFPLAGEEDFSCTQGEGGIFRDLLSVTDAEVLFRYNDVFFKDYAAVTKKKQKDGYVYYLGCGLDETILKQLLKKMVDEQGIISEHSTDGVEIVYRESEDRKIKITMNHNAFEAQNAGVTLAPFECKVEEVRK